MPLVVFISTDVAPGNIQGRLISYNHMKLNENMSIKMHTIDIASQYYFITMY